MEVKLTENKPKHTICFANTHTFARIIKRLYPFADRGYSVFLFYI